MTEPKGAFAELARVMPGLAKWPRVVAFAERALGIVAVREWFRQAAGAANPFAEVARLAQIDLACDGAEHLPENGAAVVVANHPFGGPDALAVAAMALEKRPDVVSLANDELIRLPGVAPYFLAVNLLGKDAVAQRRTNARAFRKLIAHVKGGGCVIIFPAGQVADWRGDRLQDPPWSPHITVLLQRLEVPVIPIKVTGALPIWISIVGSFGATLRRALIPRGMVSMRGRQVQLTVGKAFSMADLAPEVEKATAQLRAAVERL